MDSSVTRPTAPLQVPMHDLKLQSNCCGRSMRVIRSPQPRGTLLARLLKFMQVHVPSMDLHGLVGYRLGYVARACM